MPIAIDAAFVRFSAPDWTLASRFLRDFGFTLSDETPDALYFRCSGESHHVYILERGAPAFLGFGLNVASRADLEAAAARSGGSVEAIVEPGGGERVVLTDPDGHRIELVHGIARVAPLPMRDPLPANFAYEKVRFNKAQRPPVGAADMKRLGHIGLTVTDLERTIKWYGDNLGMIASDVVFADGAGDIMAFVRCGAPGVYSDHHTLALFQGAEPGFGHAAFEVQDFDAVGLGHYHMKRGGWNHAWGIGRHTLGSQIFDYWVDPWGHMIEHFADGDLFDEKRPTERHHIGDTPIEIWGPAKPDFGDEEARPDVGAPVAVG